MRAISFNTFTPSRDTSPVRAIDRLMDEPTRNDRWRDEWERYQEAQRAFKVPPRRANT